MINRKKIMTLVISITLISIFALQTTISFAYTVSNPAIKVKWDSLGGSAGFLGNPITNSQSTPGEDGWYNHFQNGSIYYKKGTNSAYEVHGWIRNKWAKKGWETGVLGYPITDQQDTQDSKAKVSHFEGGAIFYKYNTPDAYEVHGSIKNLYSSLGWGRSQLGYPTTDEYPIAAYNRVANHFENGAIYHRQYNGKYYTWPMMSKPLGGYSANGAKLNVTFYRNQEGADVVVAGSGFAPNKKIKICHSTLDFACHIASVQSDGSGNISYNGIGSYSPDIDYSYAKTVNGILTIWARAEDNTGVTAIYSSNAPFSPIGTDVTLD